MQIRSTLYFKRAVKVGASELAKEVLRLFPSFTDSIETPDGTETADNIIKLGQVVVAVLDLNIPQPVEELETAFKLNFTWPEARAELSEHRVHFVLSVMGKWEGFVGVSTASRALAMVTLALASLHIPLAIFWSSSQALLRSASVSNEISSLNQGQPPLGLWVGLSPWVQQMPSEINRIGVFTIGLRGFVGREVEMVPRAEALGPVVQRALNYAGYLLMKGSVVKDGDTIGYSETERLKIQFVEDHNGSLMRVMTEGIQR